MMGLFDQEKAVEQFGNEKREEGRAEGMIAKILDVGLNMVQEWISGTIAAR